MWKTEQKQVRWEAGDLYLLKESMRMKWTRAVVVDAVEGSGPRTIKETKIELGDIITCRLWQTGRICGWFQISTACMSGGAIREAGNRKVEQRQMTPLAARWQYTDHGGAKVEHGAWKGSMEASSGARPGLGERWAGTREALSTYCRILFIWRVQKRHTSRDRKISGCIRMEEVDRNWKVGRQGQEGVVVGSH